MRKFMDEDFLLSSATAEKLYVLCKDLPIVDYHCHLNPKDIADNTRYENLTRMWLSFDHYKWRLMRACGVEERFITGDAPDYDKFLEFAKVLPMAIGNPVYHWAHLELRRYFGITEPLCEESAPRIWERITPLSARDCMKNVAVVCTTDDPADNLEYHRAIANEGFATKVLPTFRPDKAININAPDFIDYIRKLGTAANINIASLNELLTALNVRADFFKDMGCLISDQAIDHIPFAPINDDQAHQLLHKRLSGDLLSQEEFDSFATYMLIWLADCYKRHGFAMQIHIGALRNNNPPMFEILGPDSGFDSVRDNLLAVNLNRLLASMNLPRTVLYTHNITDYHVLSSVCGNFQTSEVPGKIQLGAPWWMCDHIDGLTSHLRTLASTGVLGTFIGMLTDSRSFLSYPRHDYFRRILCDTIGGFIERGEYPDNGMAEKVVTAISFENAVGYFGFNI